MIDYSVRNDKVTAQALQERMTEEIGLQTFPKNCQWQCRRDVQRQCSTVGQQRPEKLDRRWLKDGCVGQQAMMSMQSRDADEPRQQMTGGIPQRDTAELSGVGTRPASLNSMPSGTFSMCQEWRDAVVFNWIDYINMRVRACVVQEDVNSLLFIVHQDSLKKETIISKMSDLNLHLEQANRQFHKDRRRKQVTDNDNINYYSYVSRTQKHTVKMRKST